MTAITAALPETKKEIVKGKFLAGLQVNNDKDLYRIGEQILTLVASDSNDTTTPSSDVRTLETWMNQTKSATTSSPSSIVVVPLSVLSSLRTILKNSNTNSSLLRQLQHELELCLSASRGKLKFNIPPPREKTPEEIVEAMKFQKRMELLRMKAEENSYKTYTTNLDKSGLDDDVTTKSMTYAASIGLNMIVAPISFGIFVYFFAAPLVFKDSNEEDDGPKKIHIGRVISAVVAGVVMLMIEMILFVIRSHELDTHTTKKKLKRSKEYGAFGSKLAADTKQRDFYE